MVQDSNSAAQRAKSSGCLTLARVALWEFCEVTKAAASMAADLAMSSLMYRW